MEPTIQVAANAASQSMEASNAVLHSMGIMDLIAQGGFIMYPLIALSILSWAVAIQKLLAIRNFRNEFQNLYREANSIIISGRLQDLRWLFNKGSKIITLAHEAIFDDSLKGSKEEIQERLNRRLDASLTELRRGLWILGTITSATPFIGLFGTVSGIMSSFHSIGASGKTGLGVVSAGIAESLIATAAGIVIAVIALGIFNYLQTKIQNTFQDFRNKVQDLAQIVLLNNNNRQENLNQNNNSGSNKSRKQQRQMEEEDFELPPIMNNNGQYRSNNNNSNSRGASYGK